METDSSGGQNQSCSTGRQDNRLFGGEEEWRQGLGLGCRLVFLEFATNYLQSL